MYVNYVINNFILLKIYENMKKMPKNVIKIFFKCNNCNKTFMSNKSLKKHVALNNCVKNKY